MHVISNWSCQTITINIYKLKTINIQIETFKVTERSSHYISLFVDLPDALTSLDSEELRTTGGPLKMNGDMYCAHFDFE